MTLQLLHHLWWRLFLQVLKYCRRRLILQRLQHLSSSLILLAPCRSESPCGVDAVQTSDRCVRIAQSVSAEISTGRNVAFKSTGCGLLGERIGNAMDRELTSETRQQGRRPWRPQPPPWQRPVPSYLSGINAVLEFKGRVRRGRRVSVKTPTIHNAVCR